jgi:hypothetical protein
MNYKVSSEIKWTFILNVLLFITGLVFNEQIVIGSSVVIFAVLSVGIQILEAIHNNGDSNNG